MFFLYLTSATVMLPAQKPVVIFRAVNTLCSGVLP
jgi:hypothetical protein